MATRVGILDDHRSFGEALCLALSSTPDFECVGVTTGIEQCKEMLLTVKPDLLIIDYQLIGMTGFECADELRAANIDVRTVMLTAHAASRLQSEAQLHGIELVLSKDHPLGELLKSITAGVSGIDLVAPGSSLFSKRQREVLELMGEGLAPADIAEELIVSIHTARRHVKDVMGLLGASTQLSAVTKAMRDGHIVPARSVKSS